MESEFNFEKLGDQQDFEPSMSDEEFVKIYILDHQEFKLSPEQERELSLALTEFNEAEEGVLEYMVGGAHALMEYQKFHLHGQEGGANNPIERLLSPAIGSYGLPPESLQRLYFLKSASLSSEEGNSVDMLGGVGILAIIFSSGNVKMQSAFHTRLKFVTISKCLNTIGGLLSLMHEIGHAKALSINKSASPAELFGKKGGRRDPTAIRASVMAEIEASNSAYQILRKCCGDEAFLELAKAAYMKGLSTHLREHKKLLMPK